MTQTLSISSQIGGGKMPAAKKRPGFWLLFWAMAVAHPAQAALEGKLETATCSAIKGWAWNNTHPFVRTQVQVYDVTAKASALLATLTADLPRKDLLAQGKGDGKHGFAFVPPDSLRNTAGHKLSVRIIGTVSELAGSPMTIPPCHDQ